jgi:hypothetical protein
MGFFDLSVRRRAFLTGMFVFSVIVFMWRLFLFGDAEPRGDHAFFTWWVLGMEASDHIVPHMEPGERLIDAMARDETGFLTQFFRPMYNSPTELLKAFSILILYGAAKFIGATHSVQVFMSLLASGLLVFVMALFYYGCRFPDDSKNKYNQDLLMGLVALVLSAFSLYLHTFSSLGPHNFGLLFLLIAVIFSIRLLQDLATEKWDRLRWRPLVAFGLTHVLALYAYKINVFLLPPATVLSIVLCFGLSLRRKATYLACYLLFIVALLSPLIPFILLDSSKPAFAKEAFTPSAVLGPLFSGGIGAVLSPVVPRTADWFRVASELFSIPATIAGLWGLGLMAWRTKIIVPLGIVVSHFTAWCFIPYFAALSLRTYLYVLPFLIIGGAYLLATSVISMRQCAVGLNRTYISRTVTSLLAGGLLLLHLASQVPGIISKEKMAESVPRIWELYYAGQGELRPMISKIEQSLPENAVLMTWGYGLQYLFRSLKKNTTDIFMPPAISALMLRDKSGLLKSHLDRRHLSIHRGAPVYLLVDFGIDLTDRISTIYDTETVLGPRGFAISNAVGFKEIERWKLASSWPRDVVLYSLKLDPQ